MKKTLQIIGWTLLAMMAYYMIEVIFNVVFRYLIQMADAEKHSQYILYANIALKMVIFIVFGCWYRVREHKRNFQCSFWEKCNARMIGCLVAIGLLGQYAVGFMMAVVRMICPSIFVNYDKIVQAVSLEQGSPVWMIFLVVVLGPIAEEVLFRGVIYGKLREGFTVTQAALISGVIFGMYHKNLVQGIYASLFGMLLAYLFEKTQSLWGAVITHMMFNLSSYLMPYLQQILISLPSLLFLLFEVLSIAVVIFAVLALKKYPNRYDGMGKTTLK